MLIPPTTQMSRTARSALEEEPTAASDSEKSVSLAQLSVVSPPLACTSPLPFPVRCQLPTACCLPALRIDYLTSRLIDATAARYSRRPRPPAPLRFFIPHALTISQLVIPTGVLLVSL